MSKCEGGCEKHRGKVIEVEVWYGAKNWGTWSYCKEAIDDDRRHGFTVNPITAPSKDEQA